MRGHKLSPVKHLYLKDLKEPAEQDELLRKISDQVSTIFKSQSAHGINKRVRSQCIKMGLAVIPSAYLPIEKTPPKPSLRITVNRLITDDEIKKAFNILQKASLGAK